MSMAPFFGIPGKLKTLITNLATVDTNIDTLLTRLNNTRAENLDDLNVSVSSRASQTSVDSISSTLSGKASQASVNTIDANVDTILANQAAGSSAIRQSYFERRAGNNSTIDYNFIFAGGTWTDMGKVQVQVSNPDFGDASTTDGTKAMWYWVSDTHLEIIFIDPAGNLDVLGAGNDFTVHIVEFI